MFTKHNKVVQCTQACKCIYIVRSRPKANLQLKSPLPRLCKTPHGVIIIGLQLLREICLLNGQWGVGGLRGNCLIDYPLWRVEEGMDEARHTHHSLLKPSAWGSTSHHHPKRWGKGKPPRPPWPHTDLSIFSLTDPAGAHRKVWSRWMKWVK